MRWGDWKFDFLQFVMDNGHRRKWEHWHLLLDVISQSYIDSLRQFAYQWFWLVIPPSHLQELGVQTYMTVPKHWASAWSHQSQRCFFVLISMTNGDIKKKRVSGSSFSTTLLYHHRSGIPLCLNIWRSNPAGIPFRGYIFMLEPVSIFNLFTRDVLLYSLPTHSDNGHDWI